MRISEMIKELKKYKKLYGDCRVVKLDVICNDMKDVDELVFIGSNELMLKSNGKYEDIDIEWYNTIKRIKNIDRKKDWIKDCEE